MSDEQSEKLSDEHNSQHEMGLMLQRRALHQMERASEKPPRDPRRIAVVSLMVVVTMCLFLLFIDKGVKVTHRIIDIWAPVIFETKKPALSPVEGPPPRQGSSASSSEAAYMISVESSVPNKTAESSSQRSAN